ncbi:MAG: tetratricopeptide repeat protein, partial [Planctomycetes bacterium]|nr:tetratricopeptide repeat protein [Planctomycetota bacterium]
MEPNNQSRLRAGTVAETVERLFLWCTRAPHGLARVEFVSEDSRLQVVNRLRVRLQAAGHLFHEISLPQSETPQALVGGLVRQLESLAAGVVSISGLAAALPQEPAALAQALYALNFNRENLARPPHRQIWWMPSHLAEAFLGASPDLNSWFVLRLRLTEVVPPIRQD